MDLLELVHEDRCTADRPFGCETCGKAFARRSDLVRHERIHSNTRPWKCDWPGCTRDFIQHSALKVHRRVHTGERPHKCEYAGCEKAFSDSSSLARHRRIHTGKRPYKCHDSECGRTFCRKTTLTKHVRKHHPSSPDFSRGTFDQRLQRFIPAVTTQNAEGGERDDLSPLSASPPPEDYYSDGAQLSTRVERPAAFRSYSYTGSPAAAQVEQRRSARLTRGLRLDVPNWQVPSTEEQERLRQHLEETDLPKLDEQGDSPTFASPPPRHPKHMMQQVYATPYEQDEDVYQTDDYPQYQHHFQYHTPAVSGLSPSFTEHHQARLYLPTPTTPKAHYLGYHQPAQNSWSHSGSSHTGRVVYRPEYHHPAQQQQYEDYEDSPYRRYSSNTSLAPSPALAGAQQEYAHGPALTQGPTPAHGQSFSAPTYTLHRPRRASYVSLSSREPSSSTTGYLPSGLASSSSNAGLGISFGDESSTSRRYSVTQPQHQLMHQFSSGSGAGSPSASTSSHYNQLQHSLARQASMSTLPSFMQQDEEEEHKRMHEMEEQQDHQDGREDGHHSSAMRNARVMLEDSDVLAPSVGVFI